MGKMRTTTHHGRGKAGGAGKAFGSKHNDRNFDVTKTNHIEPELVKNNVTWNIYDDCSFETAELRFYEEHFQGQLDETNANYRANGHPERCKKMDDWKKSRRHAPEESLIQIGDKHTTGNYVDGDTLLDCFSELLAFELEWNEEHGRPFTMLNYALHVDEPGCPPHIHSRKVWHHRSEDGSLLVGQERALEQAGVELPNPDKYEGRYNNRKMTYDAMVREKWIDICESRGIEIEREPLPNGRKKSKDKEDYIREKFADIERQTEKAVAELYKTKAETQKMLVIQDDVMYQGAVVEAGDLINTVKNTLQTALEFAVEVNAEEERAKTFFDRIIENLRPVIQKVKMIVHSLRVYEVFCNMKERASAILQKSLNDTLRDATVASEATLEATDLRPRRQQMEK